MTRNDHEPLEAAKNRLAQSCQNLSRTPKSKDSKMDVVLRLDQDVVDRFMDDGPDWQIRMSNSLRKTAGLDFKNDYVAYFSTMITATAFIPVFADMMLNGTPECLQNPSCSYSQKIFLASSNLFFYLFAGISISFMWLLLGRLKTNFLRKETWINFLLPPEDDSGAVSLIVMLSMTVGLIFLSIIALGLTAPQAFENLFFRIQDRVFIIFAGVLIMAFAQIIYKFKYTVAADLTMAFGLMYIFIVFIPD